MLRVDHAGELAAVHIYRGQRAVLGAAPGKGRIVEQLTEMEGHEAVHLARFDALLNAHQVRPTLMAPFGGWLAMPWAQARPLWVKGPPTPARSPSRA